MCRFQAVADMWKPNKEEGDTGEKPGEDGVESEGLKRKNEHRTTDARKRT